MINIKTAATAIAAVAVTGVTVQQIITRTRKDASILDIPTTVVHTTSPELSAAFVAFNKAQDVISDRMLAGYYDDQPDGVVWHDHTVLQANFLNNEI